MISGNPVSSAPPSAPWWQMLDAVVSVAVAAGAGVLTGLANSLGLGILMPKPGGE